MRRTATRKQAGISTNLFANKDKDGPITIENFARYVSIHCKFDKIVEISADIMTGEEENG